MFGRKKQSATSTPEGPGATPDLAALRQPYQVVGLNEADLEDSPFDQFQKWFTQAKAAGIKEPNAMTLATASTGGEPAARVVLLKGLNAASGFAFFTNYASAKAGHLDTNPRATLVFYWDRLDRQVRITGAVRKLDPDANDAYFKDRPRGSQLGAWASPQSSVIPDRATLEQSYADAEQRFAGGDVHRPDGWGGYVVVPETIEFWQGQPSRLHDRLRYVRDGEGAATTWRVERLAP